jgi:ribose transport system substrate-binding protein
MAKVKSVSLRRFLSQPVMLELMRTINDLTAPILAIVLVTSLVGDVNCQTVDPTKELVALQEKTLSKGPSGEEPAPASSVSLSAEEIERIRGLKAKAAIVMHYMRNDWSQAQVAGLTSQFDKMGIEVIAVTDAGFRSQKQVNPHRFHLHSRSI